MEKISFRTLSASFMMLFTFTLIFFNESASGDKGVSGKGHHDQHKAGVHRHKKYQHLKNPVEPTPENLLDAIKLYKENCAGCHGDSGKGDGVYGEGFNPSDFTDDLWRHGFTDGEIYNTIANGVPGTVMTEWKSSLKDEDIWKLVHLLKGFSANKSK